MLWAYPIPTEEDDVAAGWPTEKAIRKGMRTGMARIAVRECLERAGLPELVSHAEVRQILGTKNPRLPAGTPDPLYEDVGGRQLWLRDDIVAFAEEFKQRPNVVSRRRP